MQKAACGTFYRLVCTEGTLQVRESLATLHETYCKTTFSLLSKQYHALAAALQRRTVLQEATSPAVELHRWREARRLLV